MVPTTDSGESIGIHPLAGSKQHYVIVETFNDLRKEMAAKMLETQYM